MMFLTDHLARSGDKDAGVFFEFIKVVRNAAVYDDFFVGSGGVHEASCAFRVDNNDANV